MVEPNAIPASAHEAQLYISLFPHMRNVTIDTKQLERTLKTVLQSEGDLFAFKPQNGVKGSILSAVVEYCETDMAKRASSKFNNVVVGVSIPSVIQNVHVLTLYEQGFQICVAPYRPDLMTNGIPRVSSGTTQTSTMSDLAAELQQMSLGRSQSAMPSMGNSMFTPPARPIVSPDAYQLQQPYGMVPLMYQGMQGLQGLHNQMNLQRAMQGLPALPVSPVSPFMLDRMPSQLSSASSNVSTVMPSDNYSLASSMITPQGRFFSQDFLTPRQFHPQARTDGRRQNAIRVNRSPYYNAANHHNHVDINRIREGIDVRTTVS